MRRSKNILLVSAVPFLILIAPFSAFSQAKYQPGAPQAGGAKPGGQQTVSLSSANLRMFTLALQQAALKCDEETIRSAQAVFQSICKFRRKHQRVPRSAKELKSDATVHPTTGFPPVNPYTRAENVSIELRTELEKLHGPLAPTEKLIFENDEYLSPSFLISLSNMKLKPATDVPGTIVVKYNGNDYVAVYCMGFSGQIIQNPKTSLPLVLFKDFSSDSD